MINDELKKANWKLFLFSSFMVPMIGFCRPRVVTLKENEIAIKIPLRRRTKNHVNSMYLGVMTIGADLASGFLAFYILQELGLKSDPIFKGMEAEYFKRAESDVIFVCKEGETIRRMIDELKDTKERITHPIVVEALCNEEKVAQFSMNLSLKLKD